MFKTDVKCPILYVEGLRIDAYFSIRDIKRLKLLREDYEFYSRAGAFESRFLWISTMAYCDLKISEIDPNYQRNK